MHVVLNLKLSQHHLIFVYITAAAPMEKKLLWSVFSSASQHPHSTAPLTAKQQISITHTKTRKKFSMTKKCQTGASENKNRAKGIKWYRFFKKKLSKPSLNEMSRVNLLDNGFIYLALEPNVRANLSSLHFKFSSVWMRTVA